MSITTANNGEQIQRQQRAAIASPHQCPEKGPEKGHCQPIKILVVDDHEMLRAGLKALLRQQPQFEVIGEAADGRTAVRTVFELAPDVVIMDITMPDLNGIDATHQITQRNNENSDACPPPKVIALSAHSEPRFALEMLRAGASGFVRKESAFEELASAISAVVDNKMYLSSGIDDGRIASELGCGHGASRNGGAFAALSPREREVLQLIAEGKAAKQIAMHLHVSVKTIETHRRNIMEKLDLDNVAQLTKYAIREGITSVQN